MVCGLGCGSGTEVLNFGASTLGFRVTWLVDDSGFKILALMWFDIHGVGNRVLSVPGSPHFRV